MAKGKAAVPAAPKLSRLERLQAELEKEQAKFAEKAAAKAEREAKRLGKQEETLREQWINAHKSLDVAWRLLTEAQSKMDKAQTRIDSIVKSLGYSADDFPEGLTVYRREISSITCHVFRSNGPPPATEIRIMYM